MSKISELSNGGALLATDDLIVVRSGGNVRAQLSAISGQSVSATTLAASGATTLGSTLAVTGTISATGNVGIGIAPSVKLEVNGGADGSVVFSGRSDGGNGNNQRFNLIAFADGGGSGYGGGLKIQTRNSSNVFSDAVTVTSAGNVGIGAASPSSTFRTSIYGDGSSVIGGIEFRNAAGGGSTFTIGHASAASPSATLNVVGAGNLTFNTNNTEAFRITAARDMYFGQTTGSAASVGHIMQANGVMFHTADANTGMYLRRLNSDGSILEFRKDSTTVGSIGSVAGGGLSIASGNTILYLQGDTYISGATIGTRNTGTIAYFKNNANTGVYLTAGNSAWTGISDKRLKTVSGEITGGIEKVKAMRPVNYTFNADSENKQRIGFLAQEMVSVVPEVVEVPETETDAITGDTAYWGIQYAEISVVLTAALKEAITKIETLEAKVQELENK